MRIKNSIKKVFPFVSLLSMCLTGCNGIQSNNKSDWTMMIYLCGTDLESDYGAATHNLNEIFKTVPNDKVNVVIQTGGTLSWGENNLGVDIREDKLQRYEYGVNGFHLIWEEYLLNMSSPQTLKDFISWTAREYPAKKYGLDLWDHGGGPVGGIIFDEIFHNQNLMTLDDVAYALKESKVKFESILCDACNMACLETAYTWAPYAKYLIASEEGVANEGTDYTSTLNFLYQNPTCTGAELGKEITDKYIEKTSNGSYIQDIKIASMSVIDLTKIGKVQKAFDEYFTQVNKLFVDDYFLYDFANSVTEAEAFMTPTVKDLVDFVGKSTNHNVPQKYIQKVTETTKDAVVYNRAGPNHKNAHGLAFEYIPNERPEILDRYSRCCASAPYLAYCDAVNFSWTAPSWVYEKVDRLKEPEYNDIIVTGKSIETLDGNLKFTVDTGLTLMNYADAVLYSYNEENKLWVSYGVFADVDADFDEGKFIANFPSKWPAIDGTFMAMNSAYENKDYVVYNLPIVSTEYNYLYGIRVQQYFDDPNSFELLGMWDETTSSQYPTRNTLPLEDFYGCTFMPEFDRTDIESGELFGKTNIGSFTLCETSVAELKDIPAGKYAIAFKFTDVFGNETITHPVQYDYDGVTATIDKETIK